MIKFVLVFFAIALVLIFTSESANATVFIPNNEFRGYYDQYGIYTAVGVVRNLEKHTVIPTVTVYVNDSNTLVSQEFILSQIDPNNDLPFKIKVPSVNGQSPILEAPHIEFTTTDPITTKINVIYDKTLVKHPDGHTSGYIINNGIVTGKNVRVYAAIYGKDGKFMDVGQSIENITKISPDEKVSFSMYPEPAFSKNVSYYSCFAFGEDPTKVFFVKKDSGRFNFTYLSDAYVRDGKFSNDGDTLTVNLNNPWPMSSYVNFMFPLTSDNQHFSVVLNNKQIDFLQSKDPEGEWHVAFDIPQKNIINIAISGFSNQSTTNEPTFRITQQIRDNTSKWSDGSISDTEFIKNLKFLSDTGVLQPMKISLHNVIPSWFKANAKMWSNGEINDSTFLNSANYLINQGLLMIKG